MVYSTGLMAEFRGSTNTAIHAYTWGGKHTKDSRLTIGLTDCLFVCYRYPHINLKKKNSKDSRLTIGLTDCLLAGYRYPRVYLFGVGAGESDYRINCLLVGYRYPRVYLGGWRWGGGGHTKDSRLTIGLTVCWLVTAIHAYTWLGWRGGGHTKDSRLNTGLTVCWLVTAIHAYTWVGGGGGGGIPKIVD